MILVAAIAAAIVWIQHDFPYVVHLSTKRINQPSFLRRDQLAIWFRVIVPLLTCVSFALILARASGPRPSWRQCLRQPGFVAALAVASSAFFILAGTAIVPYVKDTMYYRSTVRDSMHGYWELVVDDLLASVGELIVISWIVLAVSRRWRAKPDWIDRTGRIIGVLWIATHIVLSTTELASSFSSALDDETSNSRSSIRAEALLKFRANPNRRTAK